MLKSLKEDVCRANLELVREGLILQTFGNVSGIDRASGSVVIKPSGLPYNAMCPDHMVVVALETGRVIEGKLKPSSDTATHLVLYRAFPQVGGIVHTHSLHATAWAQARQEIPALGTTHADYWHGSVPCTRLMTSAEIQGDYEARTGDVIVERFAHIDPLDRPGVLVASHGPFAWGATIEKAVENAIVLEFSARMALNSLALSPGLTPISRTLLDRHFLRKHGPKATYGQK